ncbi:hypothetical protein PBY51_023338 [Eleginops maclovinus]|uniref:SHSP domain-containing protein n=3 Tax=Eleginops maclovinus TaxID=56733 RepID=A0AAN7WZS1_ELEMC|nr:hypothetical protein PBY51_023338 [Eleginops maclovinus]
MLCSPGFQSALSPFTDFYGLDLRSEVNPLLQQQDLLRRNLQELHSLMDTLQTNILEGPFHTTVQPAVSCHLQEEGGPFGLTLDTRGFSPEELSVRQEGRKLRVSGKTEKKQEDGCYSYRRQEFTQEFDLPEGPDSKAVSCYLAPDGMLHIQSAEALCEEEVERELTIRRSAEENTQQSVCSHTEGSSTQENPEHMD